MLGLAVVAGVSIPVLGAGYGADPDAWLVAQSAETLWKTGHYFASRLPGYPLYEIVSAPLVGLGGCLASNTGTLAAALVLTFLWYLLSRDIGKNPVPLFLSLIFAPIVLTNAATTMDYLWSLAFILAAFIAARSKRAILSGICTGVAAGFRPSNLTLAIPLFVYLALREGRGERARYLVAAGVTAIIATLPLMLTYGGPFRWFALTQIAMNDIHPQPAARVFDFSYRSVYALGPLAFLAVSFALWNGRARIRESWHEKDPLMVASSVAVGIMAIQFFALPLERSYLLPAIPFLLVLVDRVSSTRLSLVVLLCIASMNIVNPDITVHASNRPVFSPALREGRIAESCRDRQAMMVLQQKLHNASP